MTSAADGGDPGSEPQPDAAQGHAGRTPTSPSNCSSTANLDVMVDPKEEAFYASAFSRIVRALLLCTIVLTLLALWRYGLAAALGFAAGGFVSWLNFRSLASGVQGLADRIINQHSHEHGGVIVFRFLLRYLLVGVIAYGIFKGSPVAFRGFLLGLLVPVAAMLIEAGYEAFIAFQR